MCIHIGIKAKISDFSLRGLLRVVLKPLVSEIPLVGGVQVYFLTSPEVDFDLGGIANALDAPGMFITWQPFLYSRKNSYKHYGLSDNVQITYAFFHISGLSNIIRSIVLEQLGAFVVLPNKFTMALANGVGQKQLKCPNTAGVLRASLLRAEKLAKKDVGVLGMGKSDPYATLSVGTRKMKTEKISNTTNPEWNFVADFPIEVVYGQQLILEVYDHDDPGEDESLGRATIATGLVADKVYMTIQQSCMTHTVLNVIDM